MLQKEFKNIFNNQFPDVPKREGEHWCSANTESSYNNSVHFELIKRGDQIFVEFHIETYANGRDELAKKLRAAFPQRLYHHSTYYSSYCWRTRMPVMSEEDIINDISKIKSIANPVIQRLSSSKSSSPVPQVGICNTKLSKLLQQNLCIPDYQRGYCWRQQNILDLLEDIHVWQIKHKTTEDIYHLGSVILKKKSPEEYDIIDGQQRLITLAMWDALKKTNANIPLLANTLGCNNSGQTVVNALLRARETIKGCEYDLDFSRIELSAVILAEKQPEDLAYTFFSNSNSTGKRLSDYDLLKTHHLRYVENETMAQAMSTRWHRMEKAKMQDELLHQMLFRLRNWRSNTQFKLNADHTQERDLFRHYAIAIEPIAELLTPPKPVRFDSILSGGVEFFNYTEQYRKLLNDFNTQPVIQKLKKALGCHSNGTIYSGIKALSFLFYCKFGDLYLNEAVYCIAYRLSVLRNETRVMGRYLSSKSIFPKCAAYLDRVTFESEFFAWILDPKQQYIISNSGPTAKSYWDTLSGFLENLEKISNIPNINQSAKIKTALKKALVKK